MSTPEGRDYVALARSYLQALIDRRDLHVAEIDAYADRLARVHWRGVTQDRREAAAGLEGFMDGYDAGYANGLDAGIREGRRDFKNRLKRRREAGR